MAYSRTKDEVYWIERDGIAIATQNVTGNSPAYPSGHSTQSWFMGLYMGHLYPSQQKTILKLANDIADTRLVLGVHYPSDQEFGKWIAHTLFRDPRVKKHLFDE